MTKEAHTMEEDETPEEPKRWLDDPANVQRLLRWFYWACALIVVIDVVYSLGWHKHATFGEEPTNALETSEPWPAFYGVYGFLGCAGLILVAKELRKLIMRKEDYYD
jgi:TRAP-type C4-dicarboxylate transport system permease small subunit